MTSASSFGCGLAVLMAVRQTMKDRTPFGMTAVGMYLSLAWFQFREARNGFMRFGGTGFALPLLSAIILAGITSHLYLARLYDVDDPPGKETRLLFLLFVPSLVVDGGVVFHSIGPGPAPAIARAMSAAHWIGGAFLIATTAAGILRLFRFFTIRTLGTPAKIVFGLSLYVIFSIMLGLCGLASGITLFVDVSSLLLTALLIFISLAAEKHPGLMTRFKEEAADAKYRKSTLSGVDLGNLGERLSRLMAVDEFFADEDCGLATAAAELNVTPHQLSEFVNMHLKKNFSACVNGYRIDKAKELLVRKPSQSILEIAFQVGFGNKTSFNEAFRESTGTTPKEFRREASP